MIIAHVDIHVKPEFVDDFKTATLTNAQYSVLESGIARFDVIQDQENPTHFVLVEVYRTTDDPARHKATAHYAAWRDTVAAMMAVPRTSVKYQNLYPDDDGW